MEYPQFIEESGRIKGTLRYLGYKAAPATELITTPIKAARMEFPQFVEESGGSRAKAIAKYAGYKSEAAYQRYVRIPAKTFAQEIIPTMAGEPLGITVPRSSLKTPTAGGEGGISGQPPSTKPGAGGGAAPSRMSTRVVGGKVTSALAKEPSLKSMGAKESYAKQSGGYAIGQRADYRGQAQPMKPLYGSKTKQAATASQIILTEPLPVMEGARRLPSQIPVQAQIITPVSPKLEFAQVQSVEELQAVTPDTIRYQPQIVAHGVTAISQQQKQQRVESTISAIRRSESQIQQKVVEQQKRTEQRKTTEPTTLRIPSKEFTTTPVERVTTTPSRVTTPRTADLLITTPATTTTPRPIETPQIKPKIVPTREPTPPFIPTLPSAASGGSGGLRTGARRFTERFAVGGGVGYISLLGKQKPTPKQTRQPATTMRSMAPPTRPVGKTPSVRTNVPTIKKKGRKR